MGRKIWVGDIHYPSNVDIWGKTTLTVWLCGCNLRCPFCHNHRLVNYEDCKRVDEVEWKEKLETVIKEAKEVGVEYIHVTGGEPTLSPNQISIINAVAYKYDIPISLNTNATTVSVVRIIEQNDMIKHIAFDVKLPFYLLTGRYEPQLAITFFENIRSLSTMRLPFEARFPVAKGVTLEILNSSGSKKIIDIIKLWQSKAESVIRVNRLRDWRSGLTPPPEGKEFCERYCEPDVDEVEKVAEKLKEMGLTNVVIDV